MNNSYWDILGIEPTTDAKELRRAYGKKIKQYKPDKHPVEFKEVRSAYDYLLDEITNGSTQQWVVETDQENNLSSSLGSDIDLRPNSEVTQPLREPDASSYNSENFALLQAERNEDISEQVVSNHTPQQGNVESIMSRLNKLAQNDMALSQPHLWRDILDKSDDLNLFERKELSYEAFYFLLDFIDVYSEDNQESTDQSQYREIISIFDGTFLWSQNSNLMDTFDEEEIESVLPKYFDIQKNLHLNNIGANDPYYQAADIVERAMMMLIDIVLCLFPALCISMYLKSVDTGFPIIDGLNSVGQFTFSVMLAYMGYTAIMELSPLQRTWGTKLFNAHVGDQEFNNTHIFNKLTRLAINGILLTGMFFGCISEINQENSIYVPIFLTAFIRTVIEYFSPTIIYRKITP